jgi:DNA primase
VAGDRDQVQEVKEKVDIVEIIGSRITLKKAGRHFKGLCPFHSEKSPSFIVSPERQSYKCFGCQEGGDVISFLQKYDGYSFLEALEFLAKKVGVTLTSYRPTSEDARRKRLLSALSLAGEYYHFLLTKHESGAQAREYLKNRAITNEAIIQFNLGFAPSQWRSVSDFLVQKKGYTVDELCDVGLVIRSDNGKYYDRFRGRVMFPLKDHKGVVVGFSGRTLSKDVKEAKYINSPETVLYSKSRMLYGLWENREYIRKADQILLVEGELDMIPSWQAGVKQVAAIKGSAFTEEQAKLIARYTKNVVMSLDADSAGQEAIKRAVKIADEMELSIRVVSVTGGKDPGDVATANPRLWREEVKGSTLYWDFLLKSLVTKHDQKTGSGTSAIAAEMVPALSQISNLVIRAHYAAELAKTLGIPEQSIYEEIERFSKKKQLTALRHVVAKIETSPQSRREELEIYLLSLLLQQYRELAPRVDEYAPELISQRGVERILTALAQYPKPVQFEIAAFVRTLPAELAPLVDRAYLMDISEVTDVGKEWERALKELTALYVKERVKELSTQIAQAEREGSPTLASLQAEFSELVKRLG